MSPRVASAAFAALLSTASLAAAFEPIDAMPLVWAPELEGVPAPGRIDGALVVAPFADARPQPSLVGQNEEDRDKGVVRRVLVRDDVAAWVTERVRAVLAGQGLSERAGAARLEGRIETFFVTETNRYRGKVVLALRVVGAGGEVRWARTVTGESDLFGRSYATSNYQAALSDALLRAVDALVRDPGFQAAVAR